MSYLKLLFHNIEILKLVQIMKAFMVGRVMLKQLLVVIIV